MSKMLILIAFLSASLSASALSGEFECDGLYYRILSEADQTVEVIHDPNYTSGYVSGELKIPSSCTYDSKTYSVTTIGDEAFCFCNSLTSVEIPNSVTTIGDYAFDYCDCLVSVTIGNSVTTIGDYAYGCCNSLTSVTIGNSVTTIGDFAFFYCYSLTSVEIPNSVTTIGQGAFSDCDGLTSVEIPNSVTTIGDSAFMDCDGLTSVTIGNSVTTIGDYAFYECDSLTEIRCKPTTPPVAYSSTFTADSTFKNAVLYVPIGCKSEYEKVEPWCNFYKIEEIDFSGIDDVAVDGGLTVKVVGGKIVVEGAEGASIEIYDLSGRLIARTAAPAIEGLVRGIYIVKVNNHAIRIGIK